MFDFILANLDFNLANPCAGATPLAILSKKVRKLVN
jgi:hypothetical protein